MKRIVVVLLLFFSCLANGFEDPPVAVEAAQYQQLIRDSHAQSAAEPGLDPEQTLRRANRYANQQLWNEAIAEYEKAIAAGADTSTAWLRLSQSWQGRKKRNRAQERALQSAYNAYRTAQTHSEQARSLFWLGVLYEKQQQPKKAIAALKEGLGLEESPEYAKRYRQLVKAHAFRVTDLEVDSDSATPTICLRFSAALQKGNRIHYEDYLIIQPPIKPVVSTREDRLCVEGVAHSSDYEIVVRTGLPSAAGEKTANSEQFTARVDNRKPSLGFRGTTYILPRNGGQGLPLTTVNVAKVKLQVLRINDRNLLRQINDQRITNTLDGYDIENIAERAGELHWEGEMAVAGELNQETTTAIPMGEVLQNTAPGVYIVSADSADETSKKWKARATQWLVISDLGISTFRGEDGLHVFIRSLDNALPLAGVDLRLYARNNGELGQAFTDDQGHARFDPGLLRGSGGLTPAALMAYQTPAQSGSIDFNFLDLTRPAFDLSDRGVDGRAVPGPVDAFLYTERGVYRPGENVELMILLRDGRADALDELPVTLKLFRPDGVEARSLTLKEAALGGYHTTLPLADNARTGNWTAKAYTDPEADPVGQVAFQVEDFVPQRIRLQLETQATALQPGAAEPVNASARFLYGAPAAHLATKAELVLREDPDPYPAFKNYRFGLAQEDFTAKRFPLSMPGTDAEGKAQIELRLDETPDTSRPLKAVLRVSVFEPGGRPVNRVLGLPYRTRPLAIGIRPRFSDNIPIGQEAGFDVIAVTPNGEPSAATGLRYALFREEYNYYWFYRNNRWDYKLIIRDSQAIANRSLSLAAEQPYELIQAGLDWGNYRAEVYDPQTGAATSVRFQVGWFVNPSAGDTPDRLQVTLDKPAYQAGETAKVHIKAPFAGEVLLTVASDKLWLHRNVNLPADGATIELPVQDTWGPGVYLTATAFRPARNPAQRGPGRAIGLTWMSLDPAPRTLTISMQTPTELTPRQTFELPVAVSGTQPGQPAYLTVAAVDEGILQLTDFASPDPLGFYLGKRRLGVELLDIYSRLIESAGQPGRLRTGGDGFGRQLAGSGVRTVKTVALFSGPVQLDARGQANIPLELPDFNGELRLMAVAWDRQRLGQTDTPLLVRDPLVARAYLPRFLAPGDAGQLTLNVQNLSATPGDYQIRLSAAGAVDLHHASNPEASFIFQVHDSTTQNTEQRAYTLRGLTPGVGRIHLQVHGPQGFALAREWEIGVRPAQAYLSERSAHQLGSGKTLDLDNTVFERFLSGTGEARLGFSAQPGLDVPGLLAKLDRYPYGCLEQTTSRALPLLYFNQVAQTWIGDDAKVAGLRDRVQTAIGRVLSMQRYEGAFGLWNADSPAEYWLSAYALDFLTRAREEGYLVPESPYRRGLDWLQQKLGGSNYDSPMLAARTYALYVLARAGLAAIGDLRYLHDNYLPQLPSELSRAQLGAALARYGDLPRAREAFAAAVPDPGQRAELRDYGTTLRDQAALVTLQSEAGVLIEEIPQRAEQLAASLNDRRYSSTQEQSWLLLAAHALLKQKTDLRLRVNGQTITPDSDPYYLQLDETDLGQGLSVNNPSQQALWYTVSTNGIPAADQPPEQSGFAIARRYYTRTGDPVDPAEVRQNDLLVVLITGAALGSENHQALIVDLLPAGLEIENTRLANNESTGDLDWLPELSTTLNMEFRDDRFVAAMDLEQQQRNFAVAYLVRAVTPGDYRLPAVFVEDMYKPWYFGRGAMGNLSVID